MAGKLQIPEAFRFLFDPPLGELRHRGAYGGRGSAKSHAFASALVTLAAQQPLRILCCREIQKSIEGSVKQLLDDKIAKAGLMDTFYQSHKTEIVGSNGSLFRFAGLRSNPTSVKSMEGLDIAWIEEANTVSTSSMDILTPTLRTPQSEIWATWNPELPTDPIDAMFRDPNLPRTICRPVSWRDNPFFPDVLAEEMEYTRRRDPAKYQWIWEGEYRKSTEAAVFKNWRVEDFDTPNDAQFRFGADWGFSVDPVALIRLYIVGRTIYIDREVYKINCEVDQTPALFDQIDPGDVGMARKWPMRADSARPEIISYMRRNGYPKIERALKGKGSVEEGVMFLQSYDIVVHPRCRHMIEELTLYCYKTDKLTDEVLPVLEDANNHCIDAARYALESLRRATGGRVLVGAY